MLYLEKLKYIIFNKSQLEIFDMAFNNNENMRRIDKCEKEEKMFIYFQDHIQNSNLSEVDIRLFQLIKNSRI